MKLARAVGIATLVLVVAITPLSAVTAGGHFEYRYPATDFTDWSGHTVIVDDRTGLVAGIGPGWETALGPVSNIARSGNWLHVQWSAGGCETHSRLVVERMNPGYRIDVTSGGRRCAFLHLAGYSLVIKLWAPIDASTVTLVSEYH